MKLPGVNLKKLDSRIKTVVYLGKESGTKAFRLYDPETKTICVSRNVEFEERRAWNWVDETEETQSAAGTFIVFAGDLDEATENNEGGASISNGELTPGPIPGHSNIDTGSGNLTGHSLTSSISGDEAHTQSSQI